MAGLERIDVQNEMKERGGSKLTYSSSIPTIKPLAANTGIYCFLGRFYLFVYVFLHLVISLSIYLISYTSTLSFKGRGAVCSVFVKPVNSFE